ncbi:uncharacterized protein [Hemitrygon akajei]|uniref:uncharacterized protein n=1 Tax=Hemitrygon akajei TaxID=2704970 RepID=UPI003BF999AD
MHSQGSPAKSFINPSSGKRGTILRSVPRASGHCQKGLSQWQGFGSTGFQREQADADKCQMWGFRESTSLPDGHICTRCIEMQLLRDRVEELELQLDDLRLVRECEEVMDRSYRKVVTPRQQIWWHLFILRDHGSAPGGIQQICERESILNQGLLGRDTASSKQAEGLFQEVVCPICLDFFTTPGSCVLASLAEKAEELNLIRNEMEMRSQCKKHREELKLFCDTDKQLICVICRDAREHKTHNFMPIEEAVEIYKCQVKSLFESLTEKKSAIQDLEQRQKQKISGVREQSHSLQANVTSEFAKIHQVLAEREQRLLSDLRAEEEKILNTMEKNLQEIEENLTSVEEKLSKLQEQMNKEDSAMFLKEELCQDRRVNEQAQTLSVTEGAVTIGEFRDTILRGMFDAMKQVYKTLDVESAKLCIKVSEDLNRTRGTGTQNLSLPDTRDSEEYNKPGDWGMKLLSEALRDPECKIQKLGMTAERFTSDFEHFCSALITNRSLREVELDLSDNKLGDWGMKPLSEALRNPECKIQKLGLRSVGLTAAGVVDLVSALSTNRSLTELDLAYNELGDSGVKLVSEVLRNPECKIQKLRLQSVGLTADGVVDLASALRTNRSLTELDLADNELGDSGVKLVFEALRNPECKLQRMGLRGNRFSSAGKKQLKSLEGTRPGLRVIF